MPDYPAEILDTIQRLRESGPLPEHVAIIMDGNARWARRQDKTIPEGHRQGVKSAKAIADLCGEIEEIDVLTLYAFSTENWSRPDYEIRALMELLKEFLRKEVDRMVEQNVRFRTIGCPEKFPEDVREEIKRTKELTRENDRYVLNLALSYGGRDDLVRSFQEIAEGVKQGEYKPEDIDESLVSRHLDTADLPDPDLLIRTSGEKRLSNYLLWQVAYTEIYFSEILWPEFRERKFLDSLFEYQSRDRRFGDRKPVDT